MAPIAHAEVPPALLQYVRTPEHQALIQPKVLAILANNPECSKETARFYSIVTNGNVDIDASGRPTTGTWKDTIKVDGCRYSGLFNIFVIIDAQGVIHAATALPGTTHAGLQLQRDALLNVLSLAKLKSSPDCQNGKIVDTIFRKYTEAAFKQAPPNGDPRSWHEDWVVRACDKEITEDVTFIPHPGGTSITVALTNTP